VSNNDDRDTLSLQDEDRLPWLEAVDDDADEETISTGKLIGFGIAALVALAVVIGGISLLRSQPGPKGDGKLIAAQEGDYKVRPDTPGGMKVEGQGDSSFAASEGAEANGKIDTNAAPEAPVKGAKAVPPKPGFVGAPAKPIATASVPTSGGKLVAPPPAKPITTAAAIAAPSGALVQLGAFGSEAKANEAWTSLARRFGYLSNLPKSVVTAQVNGNQVYRLRANAGGQASTICGKLKVAGENCMIVN
jgi:SPOR domain